MIKEITIILISAKDCPDCREMKETLLEAIKSSSAYGHCRLNEIDSESDEAIDIAVENDIDDLPGCVIGSFSFCGKDGYTCEEFTSAIEETWKNI